MPHDKRTRRFWEPRLRATTTGDGGPDLAANDSQCFRRQEMFFAPLNLVLIGALLTLQEISRIARGRPAAPVVIVLTAGFVVQAAYVTWLYSQTAPRSLSEIRPARCVPWGAPIRAERVWPARVSTPPERLPA